jgi:hypothetical protein
MPAFPVPARAGEGSDQCDPRELSPIPLVPGTPPELAPAGGLPYREAPGRRGKAGGGDARSGAGVRFLWVRNEATCQNGSRSE